MYVILGYTTDNVCALLFYDLYIYLAVFYVYIRIGMLFVSFLSVVSHTIKRYDGEGQGSLNCRLFMIIFWALGSCM